ncbi:hypothetical protein HELRODRAFT_170537 [Helobdella robusta]|uniref:Uncharacterized protein n=1 Tax=Helobdella robusta TaxID=6412 RepID=T1F363_HELRO|nr:hypothetical protein HELRODRAFT_170537 [Helobdella robusta]ESO07224.1 hypothetical protein HELRODRAFT_170537 [Helobdella robusta]
MTSSSKSEQSPVESVDSGEVSIVDGANDICPSDVSAVHAFNGNCLNVTLPDGKVESRCILPMVNCTRDHQENDAQKASASIPMATTAATSTTAAAVVVAAAANQHPHPSKNILDNKNGVSIGFIIGAILVVTSGIVLIGVGAKKCYEKHVNSRSEYNYAQLTIDMNGGEEDDDERLILP